MNQIAEQRPYKLAEDTKAIYQILVEAVTAINFIERLEKDDVKNIVERDYFLSYVRDTNWNLGIIGLYKLYRHTERFCLQNLFRNIQLKKYSHHEKRHDLIPSKRSKEFKELRPIINTLVELRNKLYAHLDDEDVNITRSIKVEDLRCLSEFARLVLSDIWGVEVYLLSGIDPVLNEFNGYVTAIKKIDKARLKIMDKKRLPYKI